jgi:hypothetical protein
MTGAFVKSGFTHLICAVALLSAPVAALATGGDGTNCEVALSSAQIDYGRLSRATMVATANGELVLPPRTITLTISCRQPQDMTVLFKGLAADTRTFRFTDRGRFSLRLHDALLDGGVVDLGQLEGGGGGPLRTAASLPWLPGQGLTPVKNGKSAIGRSFTAQIDIEARVDEQATRVRDTVRWSAEGTVDAVAARSARPFSLRADILAGRCNVEVVRHLSFGRVRSSDLDIHGASTAVPSIRSGQLQVACDAPMPFALRVMRDERAGTVARPVGLAAVYTEKQLFGLGSTYAGEDIGSYVLRWGATATSDQGELRGWWQIVGGRGRHGRCRTRECGAPGL